MFHIFYLLFFCISCSDTENEKSSLSIDKAALNFTASAGSELIKVETNASSYTASVESAAQTWCSTRVHGQTVTVSVTGNLGSEAKSTTLTITAGDKQELVPIIQAGSVPLPEGETKIKVTGGEASSQETVSDNNRFANSFDGDFSTIWHTSWNGGNQFPYTVTCHLEEVDQLNYLVYHPRSEGSNGNWGQIEIYAQTRDSDHFVKIMNYDCGKKSTFSKIMLATPVINPKSIRITVKSAEGGHASCAELEFYRGTGGGSAEIGTSVPLGGNTYISAGTTGKVTGSGLMEWSDPATVFSTFFKTRQAGSLELYLRYRGNSTESKIEVTCNGQFFDVTLPPPTGNDTYAYIGKLDQVEPGYVRVDMKGVQKGGPVYAIPVSLGVEGTAATAGMTFVDDAFSFYWGRRGPSVHMNYTLPDEDCEWFYNEITVPVGMDPVGSYFMSNGFDGGYFGMQVNEPTERRVLFSVWSPYETDDPTTIPEEYRVKVMKVGPNVICEDFGGEGSGGKTYLLYNWKAGQTYKFLTRIRPVENGYSEFTSYFFAPQEGAWRLISQMLRPKTQTYYRRAHSFLENFNSEMGHLPRRAYYNNQWARTKAGVWVELTKGRFSVDGTGDEGWRLDFTGGVDEQGFFLQNCGFFNETTKKGEQFNRAAQNNPPQLDVDKL